MDIFKKCFDFTNVDDARKLGIYPYFHALETKQGLEAMMEGHREIMIGSNSYLGLTGDSRVIKAGVKALEKFAVG